jgi:hypothetical protein
MRLDEIEVPAFTNVVVDVAVRCAVVRYIIFPLLMVVAVIAGLIFGTGGTVVVLLAVFFGCIIGVIRAALVTFSPNPIETWEGEDGTVHVTEGDYTLTVQDWNKWFAGLTPSQQSRITWRPARDRSGTNSATVDAVNIPLHRDRRGHLLEGNPACGTPVLATNCFGDPTWKCGCGYQAS